MYEPRKSILQMFDPLMANSPSPTKREESNASPDNSDKENDVPRDPLSLSQYFNQTYHVKSFQPPLAPKGKLIDFGDASIDEDDEFAPPGSCAAATEVQPDSGGVLLSTPLPMDLRDEGVIENAPFPSNGPFVTPQNRKILGDIDVDALQPPKPPTKQGALKISFLTAPNIGSPHGEIPTANVTSSDSEHDNAIPGPLITLYPPTFGLTPPVSSSPQISDKVDNYLSPQPPLSRPPTAYPPRRSPLSSGHTSHRVSIDLQSSLQLQLQNGEYSFNLINDKVSFLESSQEFIFPESDGGSDMDDIIEGVNVDDMLKSLTMQDKAEVSVERIPSSTSEEISSTSIPERCSKLPSKSETPRTVSPVSKSSLYQDLPETRPTTAVLSVAQKRAGPVPRPALPSRSSVSGLRPIAAASKPPMRVLVPPTKRPSLTTSAQFSSVIRPPGRQSATDNHIKPAVATTKTTGKSMDGPRRVLVQASDKPAPRSLSTSTMRTTKTRGPQRVLLPPVSGVANPIRTPLGLSSSINPPAPVSRLPGPSRIAVPSTLKSTAKTSSSFKPAGRWV